MLKPCEQWNERLSAWLDGEGNVTECAAVEAHLAACPACRAAAEMLRCDAQDAKAALTAHAASDTFSACVMAQVAVTKMDEAKPATPAQQPSPNSSPNWFGVLLQWGLGLAVFAVIASILFPVFAKTREKSRPTQCMNNLRQIDIGLLTYTQEHNDTLPSSSKWEEATGLLTDSKVFICPTYGINKGNGYGYNVRFSEKSINAPSIPLISNILVVADCKSSDNLIHSVDDIDFRHSGKAIAAFADGHVALINPAAAAIYLEGKDPADISTPGIAGEPVSARLETKPAPMPTIAPPTHNYGLVEKLMIAYTASLALQSVDVQGAMERAERLFRQYDGFVLNSEYHREDDNHAAATVSGRVPSEKLGQLLVDLDGLGRLQSRTVNGEDLTATNIAQVEKLGDLADTQQNLSAIENRAKPTEALKAESSRAGASTEATGTRVDQYKLKSKVVLAEVTVQFSSLPKPQPKTDPWKGSVSKSFSELKAFGTWLFTRILIPLGIWLPVWGPLTVIGIVLRRRYRRRGV